MNNINTYKLTNDVTVGDLLSWIEEKSDQSKKHIIKLIKHRFENRYLKHVGCVDSGFLIMAVCCFVIEALQSFREGKETTKGFERTIFQNFFSNERDFFHGFSEISKDFYENIRCGILHQSETKNAWRILRTGKLLDTTNYSINAKLFIQALDKSIEKYLRELNQADFSSEIWQNAFLKLKSVCENCKRKPQQHRLHRH